MNTEQQRDLAMHLTPFSNWHQDQQRGGRRVIVRGEGVYVYDAAGNQFIDGMSGLWTNMLGHSNTQVINAAIQQLQQLPFYNTFFNTTNPPIAELSRLLSEVTPPQFSHFIYGCSGSDAIDTMYKVVRAYWQGRGNSDKRIIVARKNAYHGSSVFGAALGGMQPMNDLTATFDIIRHINQPYTFGAGVAYNDADFGLAMAAELQQLVDTVGANTIAAFVGEPVQGAGGVIVPPENYWPAIEKICRSNDILLVCDEVITGFGRTGKWFGHQHYGINPDILTIAKALSAGYFPISAVAINDTVAAVVLDIDNEFAHGYTWSGHPVMAAAACASVAYCLEHNIPAMAAQQGKVYGQHLETLLQYPLVGEVRNLGLMGAIELVKNKKSCDRFETKIGSECRDLLFEHGVIMRSCGEVIVSAPPATITAGELEAMFKAVHTVLRMLSDKYC